MIKNEGVETPNSEYERPAIVWEDSFESTAQAAGPSCAKEPLQSFVCDSRPTN